MTHFRADPVHVCLWSRWSKEMELLTSRPHLRRWIHKEMWKGNAGTFFCSIFFYPFFPMFISKRRVFAFLYWTTDLPESGRWQGENAKWTRTDIHKDAQPWELMSFPQSWEILWAENVRWHHALLLSEYPPAPESLGQGSGISVVERGKKNFLRKQAMKKHSLWWNSWGELLTWIGHVQRQNHWQQGDCGQGKSVCL